MAIVSEYAVRVVQSLRKSRSEKPACFGLFGNEEDEEKVHEVS